MALQFPQNDTKKKKIKTNTSLKLLISKQIKSPQMYCNTAKAIDSITAFARVTLLACIYLLKHRRGN